MSEEIEFVGGPMDGHAMSRETLMAIARPPIGGGYSRIIFPDRQGQHKYVRQVDGKWHYVGSIKWGDAAAQAEPEGGEDGN